MIPPKWWRRKPGPSAASTGMGVPSMISMQYSMRNSSRHPLDWHYSAEPGSSEKVARRGTDALTKPSARHRAVRECARLLPSYQRRSPGAAARSALPSYAGSYSAETETVSLLGDVVALGPAPTDADRRRLAAPLACSDA